MLNRLTSLVFLGTVWGLSSAVNAADKPASYAADGKCFCNLPIPASLSDEIVSTPIGGQSLAQVCERVGKGPELKKTGNSFNFTTFNDMQCGHGPGLTGFDALLQEAGMKKGETGPKWDLATAYASDQLMAQQGASAESGGDAATDSLSADTLRFKTRYIKAPASTKTASTPTKTRASSSASSASSAPIQQASVPAQTEKQRQQIESLPLATVEPLEGESSVESSNAPIADASILTTEVETVAATIAQPSVAVDVPATTAIRTPSASIGARARKFEYLSIMPMAYDFGGAGVQVAASSIQGEKFRVIGRLGLAEDYQEAMLGVSYVLAPANSDRLTFAVTGGLEYGRFDLQSGSLDVNSSSTGGFARAKTIYDVSRRFELQGGLGYSSFFDGDPHVFGTGLFHMTQKLDFIGEFEVGDNDSAGIGIRYHY